MGKYFPKAFGPIPKFLPFCCFSMFIFISNKYVKIKEQALQHFWVYPISIGSWRLPQGTTEQLNHSTRLIVPLLRVPVFERKNFFVGILFVYLHFTKITEKIYTFGVSIAMT